MRLKYSWLFLGLLGCLSPSAMHAQVVISQVYGGGGNSGATLINDFVELFNRGFNPVNLNGYAVQYGSSTGTSFQVTPLSGIIMPGQYFLVKESAGAGGTVPLTGDVIGTINMSATAGKVALTSDSTALTGSGCPMGATVVDFVGFGTGTNCAEGPGAAGAPTATLSNTTAALRAANGCTDTKNNASDFTVGAPNPRNTSTATNSCSLPLGPLITNASPLMPAILGQPYTVTFVPSGASPPFQISLFSGTLPPGLMLKGAVLSGTPTSVTGSPFSFALQVMDAAGLASQKTFSLAVTAAPVCTPTNSIAQIQGSGITSPLVAQAVTTSGIVIGIRSNGFFIQMPPPGDGNPATSDGVFVFTSSAPTASVALGNLVCVSGTVAEFAPSTDPTSPTTTELSQITSVFSTSTGNALPPPVVLTTADLDPNGGVYQLEKYEGMRVQVNSLTVVAPTQGTINETTATSTSTGIFFGVLTGVPRPFREPGIQQPDALPAAAPNAVPRFDSNPEILGINSLGLVGSTAIDVATGALLTNIVGPLDFTERYYTIDPDPATPPVVTNNTLTFTAVPQGADSELTVASFNMERFFDTVDDPATSDAVLTPAAFANRLTKASLAIRKVLRYPDIIGVEEQENIGTLQAVAAKVNGDAIAAGDPNPNYQAYLVEGNDIGGIDVGFLSKSPKVNVIDVVQYGKNTMFTDPTTNALAILNDRPPLVLRATVSGLPVTVIVNHLRSLSGIDGDTADAQRIRFKREAQAEFLANLIQGFQNANPSINLVSIGDYNAFQFNDGYADVIGVVKGAPAPVNQVVVPPVTITNPQLTDLVDTLPASQRYSYTFSGSAQEIDHILVNPNALARLTRFAIARNDADFPEVYRNDITRPERISDHDMPTAYFNLAAPPPSVLGGIVSAKSGPSNGRIWTLAISNPGPSASLNTSVNSFTLTQTFGAACAPLVAALPSIGTIAAGGTAVANIQIDFTGCAASARFKLVTNFTGNGGAALGTLTLNNQFQ